MHNLSIKIRAIRLIAICLPILVVSFYINNVFAIEYGGFGGRPAYPQDGNPRTESIFVHTLEPGDTQEEGVLILNNTSERKTILINAVDSVPSTEGAFACSQVLDKQKDVGTWIELEKSEITLEPGTNEIDPFTINVPENASAGEHNGCIVMQEKKEETNDKSGASLSFRTGLRVVITIPGDLTRNLEIVGFTVKPNNKGGFSLHPLVKNNGNVSIDANAQVTTRYFFGLKYITHGGQYPILRGETSDWNFELKKPFWGGLYVSTFTVEYDENQEAGIGIESGKKLTKLVGPSVWFFSFPTLPGLIIEIVVLLLILFAVFLLWLSKKRKRWIKDNWVDYSVKSGENIKSLADKFNVSWKLIAKVNKLEPPYALKTRQKIKVPPTE